MDWSSSQRTESSPSGQPRNSPFLNTLPIIFKERWCLIPQQISPKQIFTSVRYWFIPVSMAFTQKTGDHKSGWGCGEKGTLLYCFWECKLVQPLWRTVWRILRELSEKAMAPHSSAPAWRVPWTEEPGGLQSMRSLRVGHDWANSLSLFTFMHWRRKWQPTPVFLPGDSQGRGSLVGCCLWGHTESDTVDLAAAAAAAKN